MKPIQVWLTSLGIAAACAWAQVSIDPPSLDLSGNLRITFNGTNSSYYILEQADALGAVFSRIDMVLGAESESRFVTAAAHGSRNFFRIRELPLNFSEDSDFDGLPDVFELSNSSVLHPLTPDDAIKDSDGDGIANIDEYSRGWSPSDSKSPSVAARSRIPVGPRLVSLRYTTGIAASSITNGPAAASGVRLASVGPDAQIPNLIRILPQVSVNDHGIIAFIAETRGVGGRTNQGIYVTRQNSDYTWRTEPVMSDNQIRSPFRLQLGPGLSINNNNEIFIREVTQESSPLGPLTTVAANVWSANVLNGGTRGNFSRVEYASPLGTGNGTTIIDSNLTWNNNGTVAFFIEDRAKARYMVLQDSRFKWYIGPLPHPAFTPISMSDAETLVYLYDNSSMRLLDFSGMTDVTRIWKLDNGSLGFCDIGSRPGLSQDGRILAFYADFQGPTNQFIDSVGPGIFALVHTNAITAGTVGNASLIRVAGVSGNGQLDPGEKWDDANTNGVVEPGEDAGIILGFDPSTSVSANSHGLICWASTIDLKSSISRGSPEAGYALVATQLKDYANIAFGPQATIENTMQSVEGPTTDSLTAANKLTDQPIQTTVFTAGGSLRNTEILLSRLVPIEMGIDVNGDGSIRPAIVDSSTLSARDIDITSPQHPFRFWLNNDQDDLEYSETVPAERPDWGDGEIASVRDLEDFARMLIDIPGVAEDVASGSVRVGFKWKVIVQGAPSIQIWPNLSPNGGEGYLTDRSVAESHLSLSSPGVVSGARQYLPPADFWSKAGLKNGNQTASVLFEGAGEGAGYLVLVVYDQRGNQLGESDGLYIELSDIKQMYVRSQGNQYSNASSKVDANTIVFLHGWRLSPEGRSEFAETFYKRLWHRGFRGLYAAYQWDTFYSESWQWLPYDIGKPIDAFLAFYNASEERAWRSAPDFANFVNGLPGRQKHVAAHSLGNIMASEALRLGMPVKNYALMQAAVPASCYDSSHSIEETKSKSHYGSTMWDKVTPDSDSDPATRSLAYRGRFANVPRGTRLTSFYLPEDYATYAPFEYNNDQFKPEDGAFAGYYHYDPNAMSGQRLFSYNDVVIGTVNGIPIYSEELDEYLTDAYEAMSYACSTWGKALGARGGVMGRIDNEVDLSHNLYRLPGKENGFGDQHSGQFNFCVQDLTPFYNVLLDTFRISRKP